MIPIVQTSQFDFIFGFENHCENYCSEEEENMWWKYQKALNALRVIYSSEYLFKVTQALNGPTDFNDLWLRLQVP